MKKMWVLYTYLLDEVLAHDLVDLRGWLIRGLEDKDGVSLLHHVGRHLPTSGFQTLGGTKTTLQQPTVAEILLLIIVLQRNWIQIGIVKNFCFYLNQITPPVVVRTKMRESADKTRIFLVYTRRENMHIIRGFLPV